MPPHWANAHEGRHVQPRVGSATPPHPYKLLGLLAGLLVHCHETFCLPTENWGQVDISPLPLGLEAPNSFRTPQLSCVMSDAYKKPLHCHLRFT